MSRPGLGLLVARSAPRKQASTSSPRLQQASTAERGHRVGDGADRQLPHGRTTPSSSSVCRRDPLRVPRLPGHAALDGRPSHRGRHGGGDVQIEGFGDHVVQREPVAHQVGQGVGGGDLHGLVDVGGPHVQGSAEDAGEPQHVVDLVLEVAPAGAHDGGPGRLGQIGRISGSGFAKAKRMGSRSMERTMSG